MCSAGLTPLSATLFLPVDLHIFMPQVLVHAVHVCLHFYACLQQSYIVAIPVYLHVTF
jgi:hypothetical protein